MQYNPNKEELKPLIEALEKKRRTYFNFRQTAKNLYWLPSGLFILCVLISLVYETPLLLCFMFCVCLALFIKFKKVDTYEEDYSKVYKETFVKPFAQVFYPKVTYLPGKFSTSNNMQVSLLYESLGSEQWLSCEDGFRGKTEEGLDFTMMEVSYRVEVDGKMVTKQEFFVSIELPKKGYRPVVVAPGSMMKYMLERYNEKEINEEPIVEQTGFEAYFEDRYAVYSQQKEDARALLTTPFLALIQKLGKQWTEGIRFSFVDDVLHIALPPQQDFFEGDLEQVVLTNTVGEELFKELSTYLSTVEELSVSLHEIKLPSKERIPLPKDLDLPNRNWDDSAYDHFIGDEL
ncbi:MAG: DUF3137 domain-containing protein [Aureispira sp.]|nr:DUF3137 domain-containing protein [Aureispira sp.]